MTKYFYLIFFCLSLATYWTQIGKSSYVSDTKGPSRSIAQATETGNSALFIDDYKSARQLLFDHLRAETVEFNGAQFIAREDATGFAYYAELRNAVRRGVPVKQIFDDYGATGSSSSKKLTYAMLKHLQEEGVQVKIFHTIDKRSLLQPSRYYSRSHEKFYVFNSQDAFVMTGRGLNNKFHGISTNKDKFLDRDLLVLGEETKVVKKHFDDTWNSSLVEDPIFDDVKNLVTAEDVLAAKKKLDDVEAAMKTSPLLNSQSTVESWRNKAKKVKSLKFFGDSPGKVDNRAHKKLLEVITNAKESVVIESPYVILNAENQKAINTAIKNGSKVEVITNNSHLTDEVWVPPVADADLRKLSEAGVEVFESSPTHQRVMHTKSYLIDNKHIVFGSNNFDNRSQIWDRESSVVIEDEELAKDLKKLMERDKSLSTKLDLSRPKYRSQSCKHFMYWTLGSLIRKIL